MEKRERVIVVCFHRKEKSRNSSGTCADQERGPRLGRAADAIRHEPRPQTAAERLAVRTSPRSGRTPACGRDSSRRTAGKFFGGRAYAGSNARRALPDAAQRKRDEPSRRNKSARHRPRSTAAHREPKAIQVVPASSRPTSQYNRRACPTEQRAATRRSNRPAGGSQIGARPAKHKRQLVTYSGRASYELVSSFR
jgi:hypothetical protein